LVLAGLSLTLLAVGCGKNVPCNTDPAQVDSARSALDDAEQQVATAKADLAEARQKQADLEKNMNNLPDTDELESRLDELKKGSGR